MQGIIVLVFPILTVCDAKFVHPSLQFIKSGSDQQEMHINQIRKWIDEGNANNHIHLSVDHTHLSVDRTHLSALECTYHHRYSESLLWTYGRSN